MSHKMTDETSVRRECGRRGWTDEMLPALGERMAAQTSRLENKEAWQAMRNILYDVGMPALSFPDAIRVAWQERRKLLALSALKPPPASAL